MTVSGTLVKSKGKQQAVELVADKIQVRASLNYEVSLCV